MVSHNKTYLCKQPASPHMEVNKTVFKDSSLTNTLADSLYYDLRRQLHDKSSQTFFSVAPEKNCPILFYVANASFYDHKNTDYVKLEVF